ncbi:MAG TPA: TlpA disulfide reductase family protein [Cytophagaceae bacterium]|jgi:thiol-disulfide isomerase/thioredoxin|nr:TlpA disulfide reductase family protein [Cytophagaceae bacterium]
MPSFYTYAFLILSFFLTATKADRVNTITLEQLQSKTIKPETNTLYVINFWATWCKPCVEELPYFETAGKKYPAEEVKILLVSLDFPSEREKVIKFVEKKNLQNEVYMLNAGNPNTWIDKIEPNWDGAIPATLMYKAGSKIFFKEGDLTAAELDSIIQTKK